MIYISRLFTLVLNKETKMLFIQLFMFSMTLGVDVLTFQSRSHTSKNILPALDTIAFHWVGLFSTLAVLSMVSSPMWLTAVLCVLVAIPFTLSWIQQRIAQRPTMFKY